ncbi:MAG: potassium channel family protein, partial [Nesterenkonia sp.]
MAKNSSHNRPVLVVGMGRFGIALAEQLVTQNKEVLTVDRDRTLVQKYADAFTHTIEADATDIDALRQLGAEEFASAVVGVGTSIESSVLIAANLVDLGVSQVWAKAINPTHGKILTRIGCHHVIYPEHDAGVRAAHLVSGQMMDFIKFDDDFAIVKMRPPKALQGKTIDQSQPRKHHKVNIV